MKAKEIAKRVYSEFRGRTVTLKEHEEGGKHNTSSYWSGGSISYYRIINLKTGEIQGCPTGVYPWTKAETQGRVDSLTNDECLVILSVMNKYKTVYIYCTAACRERYEIEDEFHTY